MPAEVRLYDRLFINPDPEASGDFIADLNPNSLQILTDCMVEPSLADAQPGDKFQFERVGYFCVDIDSARQAGVQPHGGAEGYLDQDRE